MGILGSAWDDLKTGVSAAGSQIWDGTKWVAGKAAGAYGAVGGKDPLGVMGGGGGQDAAYNTAGAGIKSAGQWAGQQYDQRGRTAINRFDQAGGIAAGYKPPTQSQGAYDILKSRYGSPAVAPTYGSSAPSYGTSGQPNYAYGTGGYQQQPQQSLYSGPGAGLTQGYTTNNSLFQGGGPQRLSGPSAGQPAGGGGSLAGATQMRQAGNPSGQTFGSPAVAPTLSNTQTYLNNYQDATGAQNYAGQRNAQGYDNALAGRYDQRSSQPYSSNLGSNLDMLGGFAQGPTEAGGLRGDLSAGYGQRDVLDNRLSARTNFAANDTTTSGALGRIDRLNPSWNADAMGREVMGKDYGAQSGQLTGQLQGGQTAGGQMISDIRSGNTQAGKFSDYLKGPESASNQFLAGYNPNQTRALDSTYSKLAAEGPTYEEDFYTSQLTGDNPAYNQLKADALRDARFSSAARGGFSSGLAVDNERRTTSRLAADEFARRGELAASAGSARRDRLGQELAGATALDQQLLGQNSLWAGTATDREGMMSQGANSADSLRAGLAGDQDQLLSDLSKFRDSQGLERDRLGSDLAMFSDKQGLAKEDMYLRGSGQQDDLLRRDQDAIDSLTTTAVDRNMNRDRLLGDLATSEDGTRTSRMGDYASSLSQSDVNRMTYDRDLDSLATNYSGSQLDRDQQLDTVNDRGFLEGERNQDRRLDASKAADADMRDQDRNLLTGARDASDEQRNAFRDKFEAAMAVGNAQAGMQAAYDMASIGAMTEAELSAIDLQLGRSGVDSATRQAFMNNIMAIAGLGIKAKTGGVFS